MAATVAKKPKLKPFVPRWRRELRACPSLKECRISRAFEAIRFEPLPGMTDAARLIVDGARCAGAWQFTLNVSHGTPVQSGLPMFSAYVLVGPGTYALVMGNMQPPYQKITLELTGDWRIELGEGDRGMALWWAR